MGRNSMEDKRMSLSEALTYGRQQLMSAGIADANTDAWQLLEYVCGCDRTYYFLHMDESMSFEQESRYRTVIAERASHIPLQQITGIAYFMGLEFVVDKHVLIPRFDTEVLVEEVQKRLHSGSHVLDMCTGSGCILLSLLHDRCDCTGVGADISEDALAVAKKNADRLGVQVSFVQTDLFEHIEEKYDIIVSNPPYIRSEVIPTLDAEVREHEPILALDGMEDGLYFYRKIVEQAADYLKDQGHLCFEIGHDQGDDVSELMHRAGYGQVVVIKDLSGLDRVVIGGKPCLTN